MAIKTSSIRTLYFYVISLIGLLMIVIPAADLINLGLKTWVFPKSENPGFFTCTSLPAVVPTTDEKAPRIDPKEIEKQCEQDRSRAIENAVHERQTSAVRDLSFLIVGIPLFWFHFRIAQRERREEKEEAAKS